MVAAYYAFCCCSVITKGYFCRFLGKVHIFEVSTIQFMLLLFDSGTKCQQVLGDLLVSFLEDVDELTCNTTQQQSHIRRDSDPSTPCLTNISWAAQDFLMYSHSRMHAMLPDNTLHALCCLMQTHKLQQPVTNPTQPLHHHHQQHRSAPALGLSIEAQKKVCARPDLPARPVRPMRCT